MILNGVDRNAGLEIARGGVRKVAVDVAEAAFFIYAAGDITQITLVGLHAHVIGQAVEVQPAAGEGSGEPLDIGVTPDAAPDGYLGGQRRSGNEDVDLGGSGRLRGGNGSDRSLGNGGSRRRHGLDVLGGGNGLGRLRLVIRGGITHAVVRALPCAFHHLYHAQHAEACDEHRGGGGGPAQYAPGAGLLFARVQLGGKALLHSGGLDAAKHRFVIHFRVVLLRDVGNKPVRGLYIGGGNPEGVDEGELVGIHYIVFGFDIFNAHSDTPFDLSAFAIIARPLERRDLTVPTEISSAAAISARLMSEK